MNFVPLHEVTPGEAYEVVWPDHCHRLMYILSVSSSKVIYWMCEQSKISSADPEYSIFQCVKVF